MDGLAALTESFARSCWTSSAFVRLVFWPLESRTLVVVTPFELRVLWMVIMGPKMSGRKVSSGAPVFQRVTCTLPVCVEEKGQPSPPLGIAEHTAVHLMPFQSIPLQCRFLCPSLGRLR